MRPLVLGLFLSFTTLAMPRQQPQNSQDVPTEKPGTSNPDVNKQREPSEKPKGKDAEKQRSEQQKLDVPEQKPGTGTPGMLKDRHPTPKKKDKKKPTG